MTANHAHTPSTDLVSSVYVQHMTRHGDVSVRQVKEEFDRFLAAAEQRGAEQAWDEGWNAGYDDHVWEGALEYTPNPYRADRLEGDDD